MIRRSSPEGEATSGQLSGAVTVVLRMASSKVPALGGIVLMLEQEPPEGFGDDVEGLTWSP
jgi:hypothetical protein